MLLHYPCEIDCMILLAAFEMISSELRQHRNSPGEWVGKQSTCIAQRDKQDTVAGFATAWGRYGYTMYQGVLTSRFDMYRPELKGWATLTKAEAQAYIVVSGFLESWPDLVYIANDIRKHNVDLRTTERLLRYDVSPPFGSEHSGTHFRPGSLRLAPRIHRQQETAEFWYPVPARFPRGWLLECIDSRRQRSKIHRWLAAPFDALGWYALSWRYIKPLWEEVMEKLREDAREEAGQGRIPNGHAESASAPTP
ncbi:uncharacterized protein EDB91DRAFT_1339821 [Suillus paluster]|uniref:uncharacterized protein n=1 Tax=Suillus paluster TaxID=48578 RepID=UPI001B87830F|nr:uncharacterized protein EDB91DRAFT_1339821 [Suillus paluster]KAG1725555.1 hypothetical protein EDB91DRAFT_1339821 [Suillus paluster]